jgi:hypothetical protein
MTHGFFSWATIFEFLRQLTKSIILSQLVYGAYFFSEDSSCPEKLNKAGLCRIKECCLLGYFHSGNNEE